MAEAIRAGEQLRWNEGSRFAYHDLGEETALFVDGEHYLLRGDAGPWPRCCAPVPVSPWRPWAPLAEDSALLGLITALYNQGSVYFE